MASVPIRRIPDMTEWDAMKLQESGIKSAGALLRKAGPPRMREALATFTGIKEEQLLQYVHSCDLMRLYKVGPRYVSILQECGIRTIGDLRHKNVMNLCEQIVRICSQRAESKFAPPLPFVLRWIKEAKELNLRIWHK
jgi:hypothetical protein